MAIQIMFFEQKTIRGRTSSEHSSRSTKYDRLTRQWKTMAMKSLNEKNLDLRVITEGKEISLKIC